MDKLVLSETLTAAVLVLGELQVFLIIFNHDEFQGTDQLIESKHIVIMIMLKPYLSSWRLANHFIYVCILDQLQLYPNLPTLPWLDLTLPGKDDDPDCFWDLQKLKKTLGTNKKPLFLFRWYREKLELCFLKKEKMANILPTNDDYYCAQHHVHVDIWLPLEDLPGPVHV